jgi:hypothetical protein
VTGGIGDVLALDAFMTDPERERIRRVFYCTRKEEPVREILKLALPRVLEHRSVWENWDERWCYHSLPDFVAEQRLQGHKVPQEVMAADDWSILVQFHAIRRGFRQYIGSQIGLRSIETKGLVNHERYAIICPYSSDKRDRRRDFSKDDWACLSSWLNFKGVTGYVLNDKSEAIPPYPNFVDLSGQTTLLQGIKLLRKASYYIGIDSSLSVSAAKVLRPDQMAIRSVNTHLYKWQDVYYAPHQSFDFVGEHLARLLNRMT